MNIARSSFILSLSKGGKFAVSFVALAFFANKLGPTSLGSVFLFQALLGVLRLPSNFGIRLAIEKRISGGNIPNDSFTSGIILKSILLIIIIPAILYYSHNINSYLGGNLTLWLIIALILQELSGTLINALRGELRVDEAAALELFYDLSWVVIGVTLVYFEYKAIGVIFGIVLARFLTLLLGIWRISVTLCRPTISEVTNIFEFAKYNAITEIGGRIHSWADVLLIGVFLANSAVGAYEVAWRVTAPLLIVSSAIASTVFPAISSENGENSKGNISVMVGNSIIPSLIIVIPAIFGGAILADEILLLIFGNGYSQASSALFILLIGLVPRAIHGVIARVLQGLDYPELVTRVTLLEVFVNLILNVLLILKFGILGAALATTISNLFGTILLYNYVTNFISFPIPISEIIWLVVSSIIMAAVVQLYVHYNEISTILGLSLAILLGFVVYSIGCLSNKTIKKKIKSTIYSIA